MPSNAPSLKAPENKTNEASAPAPVGKEPLLEAGTVVAVRESSERVPPGQHLFQQLVVAITNGMISAGYNPSKIGPAMARDIVGAAKNLAEAIKEA